MKGQSRADARARLVDEVCRGYFGDVFGFHTILRLVGELGEGKGDLLRASRVDVHISIRCGVASFSSMFAVRARGDGGGPAVVDLRLDLFVAHAFELAVVPVLYAVAFAAEELVAAR